MRIDDWERVQPRAFGYAKPKVIRDLEREGGHPMLEPVSCHHVDQDPPRVIEVDDGDERSAYRLGPESAGPLGVPQLDIETPLGRAVAFAQPGSSVRVGATTPYEVTVVSVTRP